MGKNWSLFVHGKYHWNAEYQILNNQLEKMSILIKKNYSFSSSNFSMNS